jgi:hypothetical protein
MKILGNGYTSTSKSKSSKRSKKNKLQKFYPNSFSKRFLYIGAIFALIGGGIYVYRSYASTPYTTTSGLYMASNGRLIDVSTGILRRQIQLKGDNGESTATNYYNSWWSPNGKKLVISFSNSPYSTYITDEYGTKRLKVASGGSYIGGIDWSPDSNSIAIVSSQKLKIINVTDGTAIKEIDLGQSADARRVSYSPDGRNIAVLALSTTLLDGRSVNARSVVNYNIESGSLQTVAQDLPSTSKYVDYLFLKYLDDGIAYRYTDSDGPLLFRANGATSSTVLIQNPNKDIAISRDGKWIAYNVGNAANLVNRISGEQRVMVNCGTEIINRPVISPDNNTVALKCGTSNTVNAQYYSIKDNKVAWRGYDFGMSGQSRDGSPWQPVPPKTPINTWYIRGQTTQQWGVLGDLPIPADYNGDKKADLAIYRPSDGTWRIRGQTTQQWGVLGDLPIPADYNGDKKADVAIFRSSSSEVKTKIFGIQKTAYGGSNNFVLPAGDFNGDGKFSAIAVWHDSGAGYLWNTSDGGYSSQTTWGVAGDIPVPADYNGDGKTDFAIYRPSDGTWRIRGQTTQQWGVLGDIPVVADYNGDKKADFAIWRPSDGTWRIRGQTTQQWGVLGDIPVPADYNGDGKADFAVFRP